MNKTKIFVINNKRKTTNKLIPHVAKQKHSFFLVIDETHETKSSKKSLIETINQKENRQTNQNSEETEENNHNYYNKTKQIL